MRLTYGIYLIGILGLLAGCGGSSTGNGPFDAGSAIELTSSSVPEETVADQEARAASIASRSDGLTASTLYGETDNPALPTFSLAASCSGGACRYREATTGVSIVIDIDDLLDTENDVDTSRAVLSRNGITLLEGRGGTSGPNYRAYGAWMDHGGFAVETRAQDTIDGTLVTARGSSAVGDLTGSRPTADATWQGLMVGTPARGANRDNILQGDAELTYSTGTQTIDARFSDIVDLDRGVPHSVSAVMFDDVRVETDGTYEVGRVGNRISGGFAGLGHEETGGVFEQRGIVGSYGARRVSPD